MNRNEPESESKKGWRRAARSRLSMELGGLSFALKQGFSSFEYAAHLWRQGAPRWMGKPDPSPEEYIRREIEAAQVLFPEVEMQWAGASDGHAEAHFVEGCPGGWGKDRWAVARRQSLEPADVCAYCRSAFQTWGTALGLWVTTNPQPDGTCRLEAKAM